MPYEYEEAIRGSVEMELFRHGHHDFEYDAEVINEIKEVYAKAKAFDEIKEHMKEINDEFKGNINEIHRLLGQETEFVIEDMEDK
ncbi:hypothetical protein [Mammaliicoccus fleurettii]|uniref:hypothetical protein n=1 Tax=Mammaliicoccus fleurettii TaxID=150056 RepID=UPI001AAD2E89|nr:hypothetical protein [Mammaliicoccus fleurettii]MBO3062741.1 hypothetical protein [Mammaliicoccus fleurettii]